MIFDGLYFEKKKYRQIIFLRFSIVLMLLFNNGLLIFILKKKFTNLANFQNFL